jgi:hypothetical protein
VFTDQRLWRARAFEPILGYEDVAFLLDQSGPVTGKYSTPFFGIRGIRKIRGLGAHGVLLIWSQSSTPPAGYGHNEPAAGLPPNCPTGNINAGAQATYANVQPLQLQQQQLLQFRFSVRPLALTGPKEHDIDVQVIWGALTEFALVNAPSGVINMADQTQDPADAIDSPAQGANQTLPAAFPAVKAQDQETLTEGWIFEQNSPNFRITNNGSTNLTGGAIGIRLWGYLYDVMPLDGSEGQTQYAPKFIAGAWRRCPVIPSPGRVVAIPTAPFAGQGNY